MRVNASERLELLPKGTIVETTAIKAVMIVMVVGPFLATILGIMLLWERLAGWAEILMLIATFFPIAFGVTGGLHRYFTHASFKAHPSLKVILAILGSLSLQGPISLWGADHHWHHKFSDTLKDLHSPNAGFRKNIWGLLQGWWHAHLGWMGKGDHANPKFWANDLHRDPLIQRISKLYWVFVWISLLGPLLGGIECFLWAGLIRIFLVHHLTWSINSICHMDLFGKQYFNTGDHSRDIGDGIFGIVMAILTLGECGHGFHHAFEWSARHSKLDITYAVLKLLEKCDITSNLRLPTLKDVESKFLPGVTQAPWPVAP